MEEIPRCKLRTSFLLDAKCSWISIFFQFYIILETDNTLLCHWRFENMSHWGDISSKLSRNSEVFASELPEKIFPWYWLVGHQQIKFSSAKGVSKASQVTCHYHLTTRYFFKYFASESQIWVFFIYTSKYLLFQASEVQEKNHLT